MKYIKKKLNNIKNFVYNSPIEKVIQKILMMYLECVVLLVVLFNGIFSMGVLSLIGIFIVDIKIIIIIDVCYILFIVIFALLKICFYSSKIGKCAGVILFGMGVIPILTVGIIFCAVCWGIYTGEFYVC